MIIFKSRFEKKFKRLFGFDLPGSPEALAECYDAIMARLRAEAGAVEKFFQEFKEREHAFYAREEEFRANEASDEAWSGALFGGLEAALYQGALHASRVDFYAMCRMAKKVGIGRDAISSVRNRISPEAFYA